MGDQIEGAFRQTSPNPSDLVSPAVVNQSHIKQLSCDIDIRLVLQRSYWNITKVVESVLRGEACFDWMSLYSSLVLLQSEIDSYNRWWNSLPGICRFCWLLLTRNFAGNSKRALGFYCFQCMTR